MSKAPYKYRAFGLAIDSDFALAELEPRAAGPCDLLIRSAAVTPPQEPVRGFRHHEITSDGDLLAYRGIGRFLVRGSDVLDVDLDPEFDVRLLGLAVLGPVMACQFHRSGFLVLHGSAVSIDGEAHVFLGDKGAGKSTTASTLIAAGFPMVADDVVVLDMTENGGIAVRSAFPAMKLDAELMAPFPPGSCEVIQPDEGRYTGGKSRVRLNAMFSHDAVPLGKVHRLSRGDSNGIEPLSASGALHAMIRFSHHPRLSPATNTPAETAGLFKLAARFAPLVQADTLTVKNSLEEISQLVSFLSPQSRCDEVAA